MVKYRFSELSKQAQEVALDHIREFYDEEELLTDEELIEKYVTDRRIYCECGIC